MSDSYKYTSLDCLLFFDYEMVSELIKKRRISDIKIEKNISHEFLVGMVLQEILQPNSMRVSLRVREGKSLTIVRWGRYSQRFSITHQKVLSNNVIGFLLMFL